ncbi:MAG: 1-phosphofructokinase family hexose kinase [Kiritimatiellales bacterium]|nr:1-phosphofructokinase family hexose kinase [Kiritimatiellales bacterium]
MLEFESFTVGEVNRAAQVTVGTGGKGTNTARIIRTLSGNPLLLGFSGGENGLRLENLLKEEGVDFRFVRGDDETRTCQTLIENGNPHVTELVEEAPPVSSNDWKKMVELFQSLELSGAIIPMSGKLPPGAPDSAYAELTRIAQDAGAIVIVDAPGEPLFQCLEFSPALVKINEAELRGLSNDWKNPADGCRQLIENGALAVFVTRGAQPAIYVDKDESFEVVPPKIAAVNAVGSGDAVTAGIAYELSRGQEMREALITGMACGAANALNRISGLVRVEDVERLRSEVQIANHGIH